MSDVLIDDQPLDLARVQAWARGPYRLRFADAVPARLAADRAVVAQTLQAGTPVYGLNTGLGGNIGYRLTEQETIAYQRQIIAGRMIGVFCDDPQSVAEADLRSRAGFEVKSQADLSAPLEEVTLPGGRQAVLTYKGPYAGLPAAYDELFGVWLPQSGEEPADSPSFEVYLNTPMDTAPEDLITELHLPLKG